ncbi:MAG: Serine/threonine-protein kinase StkP [bacterium ADurb.Bin429]|nr:MAG: Serine/threonine-protein kinase StkP [bacterium ADurb.Bin429]
MASHNETVPGYRCISRLHEGKLCTVWLAEDTRTRARAAVKLFTPPDNVSGQAEIIFRRECAISIDLHHPHIVRFLHAGDYRGQLYIAMEYVAGRDAQDLLSYSGCTLSPRVVTSIARQTLEALDHAHRRSIVHRDIKPSNLLLDGTAPDYHVKVTDFGIARLYRAARISGITRMNDVRGTPWFMPPEQAVNCRDVDHRADLFSLGATMYHLLTGRFVYDIPMGTPQDRLLDYVQPALVVPITARGVPLPRSLASFVMRAVDADPNQRFQSAREMCIALDALPL